MRKNRYEILRKNIVSGSLVSITSQNWYDNNGNLIPWSGSIYIGPNIGDGIYNFTGSVDNKYSSNVTEGHYKWNGTTWVSTPLSGLSESYNLPIFLESMVDEMGVMVGSDGDIEQVEQLCNFSYTQTGSTIQIYNTVNPDKLRKIVEQTYTINWGDGSTSGLTVNDGVIGNILPTISHTYSTYSGYTITITLDAPWISQKLSKQVTIPQDITQDLIGEFIYTGTSLPYFNLPSEYYLESGRTQNYLNDLEYNPPTGYTEFTYLGIGGSRIVEKIEYGTNSGSTITTGTDSTGNYSGYSFTYTGNTTGTTVVNYRDYDDGTTLITGNTTGFTKEEIINQMITRNEHFLGFVDDPTIYSDIFVERGKQGVMEKTFRLSEIDNMGELDVYGNGYFKIRKQ